METWKQSSFILTFLILAVLQIGVFSNFTFGVAVPNLLLLALVWTAFNRPFKHMLVLALAGGLALDFFSGVTFGVHTITFLLTALLLDLILNSFFSKEEGVVLLLVVCFLAFVGFYLFLLFFNWLLVFPDVNSNFWSRFSAKGLFYQILYNFIILLPCIYFLNKIMKKERVQKSL